MTGAGARIVLAALVVAILNVGLIGDAAAKVHKRHLHVHSPNSEGRAQLVSQAPTRLGPMRYFGGPKSPMWRGPVEN